MSTGESYPLFEQPGPGSLELTLSNSTIFQINGTSVENLSQSEVESLLSTSLVSLTVQKLSGSSSRTQVLQSLLEEVNDKINRENDICRKVELTKERITTSGSLNELQLSQQESSSAYFSGKSSPLPDDQISSTPESFSEPVLQSLSSLTPLYEENPERLIGKQTDSSGDLSTEEGSASHLVTSTGSASRSQTYVKLRKPVVRPSPVTQSSRFSMPVQLMHKERPMPPVRSGSYMSAITSPPQGEVVTASSQEDDLHMLPPTPVCTVHFPSNSLPDSSVVNTSNTVVIRKKNESYFRNHGSRPQSAPSARHYQVALGSSPASSSFGRYSASHGDPLALTPPKPSTSGNPATIAVLRSTIVPSYTAKSHSVQNCEGLPAVSQQCLPVHCDSKQKQARLKADSFGTGRHSRQGSSHSAEGDERRVRHSSVYNFDAPTKTKHRPQRISLPNPLSRVMSYTSAGTSSYCSGSVSSTYSISSGHATPVLIPSTPIVPANEGGPALAFDFSGPLTSTEDPLNRQVFYIFQVLQRKRKYLAFNYPDGCGSMRGNYSVQCKSLCSLLFCHGLLLVCCYFSLYFFPQFPFLMRKNSHHYFSTYYMLKAVIKFCPHVTLNSLMHYILVAFHQ